MRTASSRSGPASLLVAAAMLTACSAAAPARHRTSSSANHRTAARTRPAARPTGARRSRALPPATAGRIVTRAIPGTADRFGTPTAMIYLPPAADRRPLPVLELLHGSPGGPRDWVTKGHLLATMNAFAARHGGQAPIVVVPQINEDVHGDSECVRTPAGADVEDYLARTVPAWAATRFRTMTGARHWAIGGLSEGGTCSAMLALRHPARFRTFLDLSGLLHLTLGPSDDRPRTTRDLFEGSRRAYDVHDPLWLLAHRRRTGTAAWLESGSRDQQVAHDQRVLARAARRAGLPVSARIVPGAHSWPVWAAALAQALPWLWRRLTG